MASPSGVILINIYNICFPNVSYHIFFRIDTTGCPVDRDKPAEGVHSYFLVHRVSCVVEAGVKSQESSLEMTKKKKTVYSAFNERQASTA